MGALFACTAVKYIATVLQVAAKLHNVTLTADFGTSTTGGPTHWGVQTHATCTLGTAVDSSSLCTYTYVLAGVSIGISLLLSLVKCVTCDLCGLGALLDLIFSAAGTCWWAVGASVVTKHVQQAADMPLEQYRTATIALMWAEVAMFGALLVAGVSSCAGMLCCRTYQKLGS
ncbi:hypothetical protein N2152v2_009952 [Parachlorella kessleri]